MQKFWWGVALLVIGGGVLVWGVGKGWFDGGDRDRPVIAKNDDKDSSTDSKVISEEESQAELAKLLGVEKDGFTEVGGVARPNRDLDYESAITRTKNPRKSVLPNPGKVPYLKGNENAQVTGLMQELKQEVPADDPVRASDLRAARSTFFAPEPFDQKQFDANPQAYLDKIRPGRVFQPAQPGPDVKRLTAMSKPFVKLLQGESVQLQVKAEPGVPVSFHTPENGAFANQLKSITVAANDEGIATADFRMGKGTAGLINVLAASPVLSDQVKFTFKVVLPN